MEKSTAIATTSVASQLQAVSAQLEKLQKIQESVYKTASGWKPAGFPNALQTETNIAALIQMYAAVKERCRAYHESAASLGMTSYPDFKYDGCTEEEIKADILLRIDIITTKEKYDQLMEIKRGFEELMDKEDKMILLQEKLNKFTN